MNVDEKEKEADEASGTSKHEDWQNGAVINLGREYTRTMFRVGRRTNTV